MSFGSGGGGFGGGFGSTNTNTNGFGSNNGGFGSSTSSNNLFGGGGFGQAKPATGFGTPPATSNMFGNSTTSASTFGGGFGSTPAAQTSGFGSNTGGLFGQNKGFGTTPAATGFNSGGGGFGGSTGSQGFGAAPVSSALGPASDICPGTGNVPFAATVEKEPNSSTNQQNAFQSITFQQPYQKWSPEELRLADYSQGRKHGNASNQAGAFGQNSGLGFGQQNQSGFGTQNNNLFGGGASNAGAFGQTAAPTGGLFGQAKPATPSLFGATPAQPQSTNLFGGSGGSGFGTTPSAFGANNTAQTGTSLFGQTNTNANKPFGGGFNTPATSATAFGATPASTGFGTGGGLFGATPQQQPASNLFGQTQPAATNNLFGQSNTGTTSLFNNAPKPAASLFGATPASGTTSLFGNTQPAANTTPFGGTTNQTTNNLFGSKPATGGTGLFGQTSTQTNTGGGGLFGGLGTQNQTQNQTQTSNLFGGLNNQNNQQKPSLFSQPQQQNSGNLFGSQPQGNNLFGGSLGNNQQQQQPQATTSLFGGNNSLLGNSQQQPQQGFTASLNDASAFGGVSLFASLNGPPMPDPGPLATPLSSSVARRKSAALPMYKLQPSSASRFSTPRRGFGFSYSNYNSPGSASSTTSTPGGMTSSLLGGSFGRGLSKSMSTSSLRRSFNTEDSILAPGAFSSSPAARQYGSTGSMKKLVINRSMRNDLFNPPSAPAQSSTSTNPPAKKKGVTFDRDETVTGSEHQTSPVRNGPTSPEMEQVSGNALALARVEEESSPALNGISKGSSGKPETNGLKQGDYWMTPPLEEIQNMNSKDRRSVPNVRVGRIGYGEVAFNAPVDFTGIKLEKLLDHVIKFESRSLTIYPAEDKELQKPPVGSGLNVPSTIELLDSWPRKKNLSPEAVSKHISNLKRVKDAHFVGYDSKRGAWKFKVDHYTTYKFDEDDEYDEDEATPNDASQFDQSTLSAPPDTPTPKSRTPRAQQYDESFATSEVSQTESDPEDTFQFRKKKSLPLPGAFDVVYADEDMADELEVEDQISFLDRRSVGSQSENDVEEPMDQDDVFEDEESVSIVDQDMAGSYPQVDNTAEFEGDSSQEEDETGMIVHTPGAIIRARLRAAKNSGTPVKSKFVAGNDWASTLKTTLSPQKQDRALLKSLIELHGESPSNANPPVLPRSRVVSDGRGFATSIDLMNSLFGQTKSPVKAKVPAKGKGFEWPYTKRSKTNDDDTSDMIAIERAFHDSLKPSWGPDGTLVYAAPPNAKPFGRSSRRSRERDGLIQIQKGGVVSQNRDIRFAKFSNEASADALKKQQAITIIESSANGPFAKLPGKFSFADFFDDKNARNPAAVHEKLVWELASVLFDEVTVPEGLQQVPDAADSLRKDNLSDYWQKLVESASTQQVSMARSNEEKAIAAIAGHRVPDACGHLLNGKDFHLATLVALIEKDSNRKDIREQLSEWQKQRILSEFSQPIRAIYEILAGNVGVCDGSKGAIEDRVESFIISRRFGLDWRQAFGLRLWYGTLAKEDIGAAVERFAHDLAQEFETSKPHAWYVEQKIPVLWEDEALKDREDLLWGLLRLYTFEDSNLEAIIRPENSQLSPIDTRLTWQLSRALTSSGVVRYHDEADVKADRVTLSFASQLTSEGSWLDTVFVLLHLSSKEARVKAIQSHLAQHAGRIGSDDSQEYITLTQTYKVPAPWVWEAKALYLRSVKRDPTGEVECLIRAGSFEEAHRTFSREVAPKTIIECDYNTLRALLTGFHGSEEQISEWHLGGEVYGDYLALLDCQKKAESISHRVLSRLLSGLPAVVEESRHPGFMETVAIETMSETVAKTVVEIGKTGEKSDLPRVLRLPLTEDSYLKHTVDLSLGYYRDVMSSGR